MTARLNRYRMPAEWHRHEATWLAWPANRSTFPAGLLAEVRGIYLEMISALLAGEKVCLLVPDRACAEGITAHFRGHRHAGRLILHRVPTADVWIRDYGPIFVVNKKSGLGYTQWRFNAWGKKYPAHLKDNGVSRRIRALSSLAAVPVDRVLEGGSIDVNGSGLGLTTEQCLLNPNRNPDLDRGGLERMLADYLGIRRVIWLKGGIAGDDTDGHVDDVARFAGAGTVVAVRPAGRKDVNYDVLEENWAILKHFKARRMRSLKIIALPMPKPVFRDNTKTAQLPASYANFYVANAAVLVPVFNDSADKVALRIFRRIFSGRKVIGINCRPLIHGLGAIHCVTQQQPLVNRPKIQCS